MNNLAEENRISSQDVAGTFPELRECSPLIFSALVKRGMLNLGGLIQFSQPKPRWIPAKAGMMEKRFN